MSCSLTTRRSCARPKQPRERLHLPSLTSLRGLAALWVVLFHYETQVFPNLHSEHYTQLIHRGYLAVDLFFLLSGFVLTHVYRETFSKHVGAESYRNFISARVARLYPAHLAVLLLFVTTSLALHLSSPSSTSAMPLDGPRSLVALVANLAMVQGLDASALSWNYPEWSISLEFIAYLGFPFLLPRILRAGATGKLALAMLLVAALTVFSRLGPDFNRWDGPEALLRCLP
ncbi:MAG TPA: acyltransferase, partial [Xanthobacteraceae bacterium]|nr:acyltransferase [Xanthobacteraceae bacterium]